MCWNVRMWNARRTILKIVAPKIASVDNRRGVRLHLFLLPAPWHVVPQALLVPDRAGGTLLSYKYVPLLQFLQGWEHPPKSKECWSCHSQGGDSCLVWLANTPAKTTPPQKLQSSSLQIAANPLTGPRGKKLNGASWAGRVCTRAGDKQWWCSSGGEADSTLHHAEHTPIQ